MKKKPTPQNQSPKRAASITLVDPSYQPSAKELREDLRIDATFDQLTAAVVRPAKIRYVKPTRKPR